MTIEAAASLEPEDRVALLDLWVAAWEPTFPNIDFVARRPWFSAYLDTLMAAGAIVLIRRLGGGEAAGFATLDPSSGTIDQLAIAPSHAGRGHATALLDHAKARCPAGLTLSVNQANGRAMALYLRHGFAVTGEGVSPRTGLPVWSMRWEPGTA